MNRPQTFPSTLLDQDALPPVHVEYAGCSPDSALADANVLAVLGFANGHRSEDPRWFDVGLRCQDPGRLEIWRAHGPVQHGRAGTVRFSCDGSYMFFAIEVSEAACGGIESAAEHAYGQLGALLAERDVHVLRLWNYLDAINAGDGDDERYRLFCNGRARAMTGSFDAPYPAATAIGRQDGVAVLQVYGLAAVRAGLPIENPRQVSAWRYPRRYGPSAPTFARAMLAPAGQLLISGTAAVVGHESRHEQSVAAQLEETVHNLRVLHGVAGQDSDMSARTLLKVYVRHPGEGPAVRAQLEQALPGLDGLIVLEGDICRHELLVEVDGISG